MKIKLNSPKTKIDELFNEGFHAVFLVTGSNFVGTTHYWQKEDGLELTSEGSIKVDPVTMATNKEGVFPGEDAILGGVSEDFILSAIQAAEGKNFYTPLVDQLTLHRGDSSRSAIRSIASGKKAAEDIDQYLGADGIIDETLIASEKPNQYVGRVEGFPDLRRVCASYQRPPLQYAGWSMAELPLNSDEAMAEAKRCLRCDLRLLFSKPILPPKKRLWVEFNQENVSAVPEAEGVYQLLDEQENVIFIKGAMDLKQGLTNQLELNQEAKFFMYIEDKMYSKRESEMLQHFIIEHGRMPKQNQELENLF